MAGTAFRQSKCFSQCNKYLKDNFKTEIDWNLDDDYELVRIKLDQEAYSTATEHRINAKKEGCGTIQYNDNDYLEADEKVQNLTIK